MVTEDQRAVVEFLEQQLARDGATVERIDTHSAVVLLAGQRAWKLKRAVRFDYLDFSSAERRRQMCEAEVRLNRRTAPQLYRGVFSVTGAADGALGLGGPGPAVDWVVDMARFNQDDLFDQRAAAGTLREEIMEPLAREIASFHATAARRDDHGGRAAMQWVAEGNAAGFAEFGAAFLDRDECARVTTETLDAIRVRATVLDARRHAGCVRQCHGDLHLRNIVLLDGQPTLFDGIEFNDELACIDVWYDLAFLLMDLQARGLRRHANVVFNRYLSASRDVEALPLLPLFLACRAAIRAKTSATAATMIAEPGRRRELQGLSARYLEMAGRFLRPPPPVLVAVGGFSGTGKSTLARALGPDVGAAPGAVVLRSDEIRKDLCGVPRLSRLGAEGYSAAVTARVYATMREEAARVLAAGHSVIADAVYAREDARDAIAAVAAAASVRFVGLWLEAPEAVLVSRTTSRQHDPSDADASIVHAQSQMALGTVRWRHLDASQSPDVVLQQARA